jgi:TRAP-type C4-dicarboxylate transport system permease small subunit
MATVAKALIRISAYLNTIALWGAVVAVAVMVGAAMWQVIARYIFASPPIWTEELARYAMVWAGMLGASCAFYSGADPTLFPKARSVTGGKGLIYALLRAAGVALFAVPVVWYCFIGPRGGIKRGFIARSAARTAEMIDVPMIWFASAIPIAFILILIHTSADVATRVLDPNPKPRS